MSQPVADVLRDLAFDGGGTYESGSYLPFRPSDGYSVAFEGGVKVPSRVVTIEFLTTWLKAVATEFESSFVGTWMDQDAHGERGGTVYIDAVRYIRSRDEAIAFGIAQHQIAIWDFAAGEAITLPKEAE